MTETTTIDETTGAAASTATDDEKLELIFDQRADTYGFLSRLYRKEVSQELLDEMHGLHYPVSTGNDDSDEGYRLIATYLSGIWENTVTELAADFMRVFFGHGYDGHAAAYPYESVYTSEKRLLMQDARDEVLALYRAAGLKKDESWKDAEDHIALELEYMQILSHRTADALRAGDSDTAYSLVKTQRNFLLDHLGGWAPLLTEQIRHFAKTDFYRGLAYLTDGYLATDQELLEDMLDAE